VSKKSVLFLCVNNSCRSQMAEGLLRSMAPGQFDVFSAGWEPTSVNLLAIQVMDEIGIDISHQRSKRMSEFEIRAFDFVITVCAGDACPFFSGETRMRLAWSFEDPAAASGTEEEILGVFRRVRDDIETSIRGFIKDYG
jgi:arsenate reductase (thioredoxin)